jgi:hypothetical protein
MTTSVEMNFWDWLGRVVEKATFVRLNVAEHRDISEEDYLMLEFLYRDYYNGVFPLYVSKLALDDEKAVQSNLFTDITADSTVASCDGTVSDIALSETKTEDK